MIILISMISKVPSNRSTLTLYVADIVHLIASIIFLCMFFHIFHRNLCIFLRFYDKKTLQKKKKKKMTTKYRAHCFIVSRVRVCAYELHVMRAERAIDRSP